MPMNREQHESFVRALMTRGPDGRAVWEVLDDVARERKVDEVAESEAAYIAFARKLGADVDEPSAVELRERERRASVARHEEAQADAEATVFAGAPAFSSVRSPYFASGEGAAGGPGVAPDVAIRHRKGARRPSRER